MPYITTLHLTIHYKLAKFAGNVNIEAEFVDRTAQDSYPRSLVSETPRREDVCLFY